MGLLDWLGPVVNGTAQTVSAFGAADDARAKAKQNAVVQQIQMLRQQREDALKQSLGQSTISKNNAEVGNYLSETKKRDFDMEHPKPQSIDPLSPQGVQAKQGLIDYEAKHGYHAPVFGSYEKVDSVDSTGQPIVSVLDKHTGRIAPTDTRGKPGGKGSGSGSGALTSESVQAMYDQAQHADEVMKAFESKYRQDPSMVGTTSQALGSGAYQHQNGLLSGFAGAASNAILGMTNKDYQEYLAAQKRFGNIMGNLMSRRYSEYQGALDTQLAGLSAGDVEPTVNLKQSYRAELLKNRPSAVHTAPSGSNGLSDADLWEQKRQEGLTAEQATQFVQSRHR